MVAIITLSVAATIRRREWRPSRGRIYDVRSASAPEPLAPASHVRVGGRGFPGGCGHRSDIYRGNRLVVEAVVLDARPGTPRVYVVCWRARWGCCIPRRVSDGGKDLGRILCLESPSFHLQESRRQNALTHTKNASGYPVSVKPILLMNRQYRSNEISELLSESA